MKPVAITEVNAEQNAIAYSYIDKYTGKKTTVIHLFSPRDWDSKYTSGGLYSGSVYADAETVEMSPIAFL